MPYKFYKMSIEQNKLLVSRYNSEVIEGGNMDVLKELAVPNFINHSAMPGMDPGINGMIYFFSSLLHPAFSNLKVTVLDMVADENKVATRKIINGTHTGSLMGIAPTGKHITISVIDILSIEDGKITAHWGENNFAAVIQLLTT